MIVTIYYDPYSPYSYYYWPRRWVKHRKSLPKDIRETVLKRDGYKCIRCGSAEDLDIHHIVPKSQGGSDELSNLRTLCRQCHATEHPDVPVLRASDIHSTPKDNSFHPIRLYPKIKPINWENLSDSEKENLR